MAKHKFDNLPLEWIRVFESAGRTGNFTAAAQECGLTQAAVSQRIRNLETRIGTNLFTRQARGVTLTIEGEAWMPYVSNALNTLHRSADELFNPPLKKLVIAASTSISQLWLVPRLGRLTHRTNYQISFTSMNIEDDFAKTQSDIEIRYGRGGWPGLTCARLYSEVLTPLATPSLLSGTPNWQELPIIAVSGPRAGWQEWSAQSGGGALPIPQFRFDTFVSALAAAKAGAGVLLGSLPLCADELAQKMLVRVSDYDLLQDATYWMIKKERLPIKQWQDLVEKLCAPTLNS